MKKHMKSFKTFINENYKVSRSIKENNETVDDTKANNKEVVKDIPTKTSKTPRIVTNPTVTSKVKNVYQLLRKAGATASSSANGEGGFTFMDKNKNEVSVKLKGGDKLAVTLNGKTKEISYTALITTVEALTGIKLKNQ